MAASEDTSVYRDDFHFIGDVFDFFRKCELRPSNDAFTKLMCSAMVQKLSPFYAKRWMVCAPDSRLTLLGDEVVALIGSWAPRCTFPSKLWALLNARNEYRVKEGREKQQQEERESQKAMDEAGPMMPSCVNDWTPILAVQCHTAPDTPVKLNPAMQVTKDMGASTIFAAAAADPTPLKSTRYFTAPKNTEKGGKRAENRKRKIRPPTPPLAKRFRCADNTSVKREAKQ